MHQSSLHDERVVAAFLGCRQVDGQWLTLGMGIDLTGNRCVIGLWKGSTSQSLATQQMVSDLTSRALDTSRGLLVVTDGSKAIEQAILARFGQEVLLARCPICWQQRVLARLPDTMHQEVKTTMQTVVGGEKGQDSLRRLIEKLRVKYPGAAAEREELVRAGVKKDLVNLRVASIQETAEQEAELLCAAAKGKHSPERRAYLNGTTKDYVYVGGVRCPIQRIRVITKDTGKEIPLKTYQAAKDPSVLDDTILINALNNVSCRGMKKSVVAPLELPVNDEYLGLGKSSVSRRLKEQFEQCLNEFLNRPLDRRHLVLLLDGIQLAEQQLVAAVGIDEEGNKQTLGLVQGVTENKETCSALLEDLLMRGLSIEDGLLVVCDGSKGLRAAIDEVFGESVAVQRCQCHKKRNVLEDLPRDMASWMGRLLSKIWALDDAVQAETEMYNLAQLLEDQGYGKAAGSLREGLEETLTCQRLGLPQELRCSLTTTNIIESSFSVVKELIRRVKWWQNGRQAMR